MLAAATTRRTATFPKLELFFFSLSSLPILLLLTPAAALALKQTLIVNCNLDKLSYTGSQHSLDPTHSLTTIIHWRSTTLPFAFMYSHPHVIMVGFKSFRVNDIYKCCTTETYRIKFGYRFSIYRKRNVDRVARYVVELNAKKNSPRKWKEIHSIKKHWGGIQYRGRSFRSPIA